MPANLLGDFATKNTKQSPTITAHDGKARRRRKDAPEASQEPVGTVVIGLRMTPGEAEWIREYAWRNRTTVGRIVRDLLAELRERTEKSAAPPRQNSTTR